jgi:hypothetical protein
MDERPAIDWTIDDDQPSAGRRRRFAISTPDDAPLSGPHSHSRHRGMCERCGPCRAPLYQDAALFL